MTELRSADLGEILARVEAATGPDRELDRDIHAALDGWDKVWNDELEFFQLWKGGKWIALGSVPRFTASIDAAMALVERVLPGWGKEVTLPAGDAYGSCRLFPGDNRNAALTTFGKAATAPLAILHALLRALSTGAHQ